MGQLPPLQVYLVGGAVRDALLELPIVERDWVVVGATRGEMLARGFVAADAEFPVFHHPESGEEYALARRETKRGEGYRGFVVDAGPDVTLEEDLRRRDLTVNAMARADDGTLIDPYGGRDDLNAGLLRHVSPAFEEDPLRVLRLARFAAKLGAFGFRVAHGTHRLMSAMVARGDMAHLTPERLWREMSKALLTAQPWRFFEVLHRCGALRELIPILAAEMGAVEAHADSEDSPPVAALKRASAHYDAPSVRFAATFAACVRTMDELERLLAGLRADRDSAQLLRRVVAVGDVAERATQCDPDALYALLKAWRGLEPGSQFDPPVAVYDAQGVRPVLGQLMPLAAEAARSVSVGAVREQGYEGAELGERLAAARREAIRNALHDADLLP